MTYRITRSEMATPRCSKCREEKPREAFDWRGGVCLQSWCRECNREHRRLARSRQSAEPRVDA
jgi:hypothetical protein